MKRLLIVFFALHIVVPSIGQEKDLNYFISRSLSNSPLLKEYENQQVSFSLDSMIIRAGLRAHVYGISTNSYAPVIHGWGYDDVITNGQQLSALVSVSKSFPGNKSVASLFTNLRIQSLSTLNNTRISEQDIRKVVVDQYITTYGEQLQLEFSHHINDLLQKEDSLLKRLTQNNVYKQTDYLAFVVTLQQQLLNASQLEIQYNLDYTTLNYLAGIVDTTIVPLRDPQLSPVTSGNFANSVFYRQFELDSLKLLNERVLIGLSYRPRISLFADAGYNSSLVYKPYKNIGTSVGLNLTIPIYDGQQKRIQYSKIDIQERTRISKRDFFTRQRDQQILQLLQQLNSTDKLIGQVNKQIKYTETLITVNEKLLATGDIRLTEFILTLNNYFNAKNLVTLNYISRLKIVNQLNYWGR